MNEKDICKYIFEMGHLRRVSHEGWKLVGVEQPDSVAEHVLRAAQIGYLLAVMEDYPEPNEVVTIVAFHDNGEIRIGDQHKVANNYITAEEERAVSEQLDRVPFAKAQLLKYWQFLDNKSTTAGILAKDADYLEQAFTAKEYIEQGYSGAQDWIKNVSERLSSKSANHLLNTMQTMHSTEWWHGLKKLPPKAEPLKK